MTRRNIWIVDDSPLEAALARRALEPNFAIEVFTDGAAVVERSANAELPYVLVLDWVMPGMTGVEVCRFLRERSDVLPVLLLTARNRTEDMVEGLAAGANDFLTKPFVPVELEARVKALANHRELRDRLLKAERQHAEAERRRADAAEERARLSDLYLGIIGHDLRNPLHAISMASLLLAKKLGPNEDAPRTLTTRITNSSRRMTEMIDALLDVTRTRLGGGIPIRPAANDLRALCEQVVEELKTAFPTREINIEAPGPVTATFDYDRMSQVLSNLVSNALKHGFADSPVTVRVGRSHEGRAVDVVNRGPSIPQDRLQSLFDPFRRANVPASDRSGLGLGLYISQQIVVAHGGQIAIRSDGETVVSVRLP